MDAPLVDENLARFLCGGVSITAGGRGPDGLPELSRAVGCRVSADRRRVTVFFLASQSAGLLAGIRANGALAVVYSLPSTHRTVQLKGDDAAVEALQPGDAKVVAGYRRAFAGSLTDLGYAAGLPEALLGGDLADCVAVSFTPVAASLQTPGPAAGKVLGGRP